MTRLLYIGGTGRSGSTLLGRILGELPGFEYVGELPLLWREGLVENALCGCSVPFRECPFWTKVGEAAFGGWERLDPRALMGLKAEVDRHRFIPSMMAPGLAPAYGRRLRRYAGLLERLYRAIDEVSNAKVIVESSGRPSTAFLLRRVGGVDLRTVHLVRDSRAVAYAWTKHVRRPEVAGDSAEMLRFPVGETAARWTAFNSMMEALRALGVPTRFVRYETVVAEPRRVAEAVARHAGERLPEEAYGFVGDGRVELERSHAVAGNPMRFRYGGLDLRTDDEWTRAMPAGDRLLASALSWPLLARYGYRLGTRG